MTGQSRIQSLVEAAANMAIAVTISLVTQIIIYPWFGIFIDMTAQVQIVLIFTVVALVRNYTVRRVFNWIHAKQRSDPS